MGDWKLHTFSTEETDLFYADSFYSVRILQEPYTRKILPGKSFSPVSLIESKPTLRHLVLPEVFNERTKITSPENTVRFTPSNFLCTHKTFERYVAAYSKIHGLARYAILAAHGSGNPWKFLDDKDNSFPVQNWIDVNDGKYVALFIASCNPSSSTISSQQSLVFSGNNFLVVGNRDVSVVDENYAHSGQIELYVPGKGYLDSYVLESELEELMDVSSHRT